jgi:betaine-aldehyde dehydrogenase
MNFAWQGQDCVDHGSCCTKTLKPVLERVVDRVSKLRLGDPLDDKSQMGLINSKRHYERVCSMVQSGVTDGAKLMTGASVLAARTSARLLDRADGVRECRP